MTWSLLQDGDVFEKQYWPQLSPYFPNYEDFWAQFIVPLSGRVTNGDIHIREGLDRSVEMMAMAHYSTFYHLGIAFELKKTRFPLYEDIFYHMCSAIDMVNRFIYSLVTINSQVMKKAVANELTLNSVNEKAASFYDKNYKKHFSHFLTKGKPVLITLHSVADITKTFFCDRGPAVDDDYKKWFTIANNIQNYRNTLTHNPMLGTLVPKDGVTWVPKYDKLHLYDVWSEVFYNRNDADFTPLPQLLTDFFIQIIERTNALWVHPIQFLVEISQTEKYRNMAKMDQPKKFTMVSPDSQHTVETTISSASDSFVSASGTTPGSADLPASFSPDS